MEEIKNLIRKWCNFELSQDDIPVILYTYAKHVKKLDSSPELIDSTIQFLMTSQIPINLDQALGDIVRVIGLNVVEVQSISDLSDQRRVLYRKFYE